MLNNNCIFGEAIGQCADTQAECANSGSPKCLCKTGYYENNSGACAQSKLSLLTEALIYKVEIHFN